MRKTQLWKRYAGAVALLVLPTLGKADVILDWNATLINTIEAQRTPPLPASRSAAMVHEAMYDAVVAVVRGASFARGTAKTGLLSRCSSRRFNSATARTSKSAAERATSYLKARFIRGLDRGD